MLVEININPDFLRPVTDPNNGEVVVFAHEVEGVDDGGEGWEILPGHAFSTIEEANRKLEALRHKWRATQTT